MTDRPDNGVERTIAAAGGTGAALAELWNIEPMAVSKFRRQGYFPLPRAKDASERFDIPLIDLVAPDIRDAMLRV